MNPRTCIACRKEGTRGELFRLVQGPDGALAFDARAKMPGRGAWVHPTRACLALAAKRHATDRALGSSTDADALVAGVRAALDRKLASLALVASRTRAIAIGAKATVESLERGAVPLVVVARDAGEVRARAGDEAFVRTIGTKDAWGALFRREAVAIFAITDARIAKEFHATVDCLKGLEDG